MRTVTIALLLGLAGTLLVGSGCIAATDHDVVQCRPPTLGQELTDLHKARDTGALTEKEYAGLRAKLMDRKGHVCTHSCVHSID